MHLTLPFTFIDATSISFWIRTLEEGHASASTAKRFLEAFAQYTDCVAQQAEDRDVGRIRPIEEYLAMRRGTVGVRPSFDFFMLSEDLPDEAVKHPQIEKLVLGAIDMSILSNVSLTLVPNSDTFLTIDRRTYTRGTWNRPMVMRIITLCP